MDNRNLILAIALSVAIVFIYEWQFAPKPPPPSEVAGAEQTQAPKGGEAAREVPVPGRAATEADAPRPSADVAAGDSSAAEGLSRAAAIAAKPRLAIDSSQLHGSIALTGARIDDLTLAGYRETVDRDSPEIILLSPQDATNAYYAYFGWVGEGDIAVPGPDTVWTADRDVLVPDSPVTLSWENGEGLRFVQIIALDRNYMFTVIQRVVNTTGVPVSVFPFGLVSRRGTPEVSRFFILHEGLLGVFNGTLDEVDYDDIQDAGAITEKTTGGWIGITDKYWLTALIPDQQTEVSTRFLHRLADGNDRYQADFLRPALAVPPRGAAEATSRLFAGAKEVALLDGYAETYAIELFDRAIDFGWFYFLTKPIFYTLIFINDHVGNFGIAILLLTVGIKLIFFPLANKSYRAMSKLKKLQPETVKLRERFGEDKAKMNQELMALYKREKANPASGCLPMVVQIPVFFALYKVLFVTIEMRQAPFFGWIKDLSQADPTSLFNLFGLLPFTPPDFLMIGIWPLIMGASMFLQQRLNPQPADPIQAKVFLMLPVVFTVILAPFPAGLVIYWAWNNSLSILQQWVIMKRMGAFS
ncbi:MAG: membrane protein insertase YidC [Rhodospirillales bacterium]|jgi:YidC/Oxa1 family membrane protein insertase|nr:membrane protein insertase YidC [Rhodospirillales bacterium]